MRRYIIIASALLACAAASAQNLNPTVQVTNDYEGKLMEVNKRNVPMALPDSLLKFDWNFNYEVFDNPYRGAYEFSPYRIDMKPDPTRRDNGSFYLRAGAGYSLHPEAQLVFTPATKGRFGISIYDDFKGYTGLYHEISATRGTGDYLIGPVGDYKGFDFANRLGTTLRYDAASTVVTLDGGFDFLRTKELLFEGNKALGGSAVLRARSIDASDFSYDFSLGWNGLKNTPLESVYSSKTVQSYKENDLGMDAVLGYRLAENHAVRFGTSWHHIIFDESQDKRAVADRVDIVPSYRFVEDGFSVSVGIRFADVWRDSEYEVADYKGRKLYPDFRLSYEAMPDKLVLSAKVVGGQTFNTYSSYLKGNHHLPQMASKEYFGTIGDATVNTFDAGIGVSGRVRSIFQYGAEVGYARYYNAPMVGVGVTYTSPSIESSSIVEVFFPVVNMMNYDLLYADLNGVLGTDRVDASARVRLQKSIKPEMEKGFFAVTLPVVSGSADLVYNWNRRVFAGLSAEWMSAREGEDLYSSYGSFTDCHVPGWIDLGVTAEFKASNRFSFWAEGRNLLNQTVMRNFMIAEKGPYVTAGICLNF
jgi:hypothetical protein